jgi:DNA-directed RNA polymerase specialized sigma24 family protein
VLEELSKKDKFWRQVAYNISKDKDIADELVQEMYIKMHDFKKDVNDFYIIIVIRNLFLDLCRKKKRFVNIDDINISNGAVFELDDYHNDIINSAKNLKFYELELLDMSGEHSLRDLSKRYNINYQTINRIITKAKTKIWQEVEKNNHKV